MSEILPAEEVRDREQIAEIRSRLGRERGLRHSAVSTLGVNFLLGEQGGGSIQLYRGARRCLFVFHSSLFKRQDLC